MIRRRGGERSLVARQCGAGGSRGARGHIVRAGSEARGGGGGELDLLVKVSHRKGAAGAIGGKSASNPSALHVPHCCLGSTRGYLPGLALYNHLSTPEMLLRPTLGSSTVPDTQETFAARLHVEKAATLVNSISEACNSSSPWFIVPESYAPRDEVNCASARLDPPTLGLAPACQLACLRLLAC